MNIIQKIHLTLVKCLDILKSLITNQKSDKNLSECIKTLEALDKRTPCQESMLNVVRFFKETSLEVRADANYLFIRSASKRRKPLYSFEMVYHSTGFLIILVEWKKVCKAISRPFVAKLLDHITDHLDNGYFMFLDKPKHTCGYRAFYPFQDQAMSAEESLACLSEALDVMLMELPVLIPLFDGRLPEMMPNEAYVEAAQKHHDLLEPLIAKEKKGHEC